MNRFLTTAAHACALGAALVLALAGCGDAGSRKTAPDAVSAPAGPPPLQPAPPAAAASTPPPLPAPVPAAVASAPVPAASAPAAAARLALDGEGLRIFAIPSGSSRPLPFGTPVADALATLVAVQGRQPIAHGEKADCGAAYATWDDGLTAWFVRDRFAGWSVRAPAAATNTRMLSTASNVGVGSTRAELESAYNAKIGASTLGTEFTAGNLAGLLDSARPDARIENLWAGTTCLAR